MKQMQTLLQERKQRGIEVAKTSKITEDGRFWKVQSQSNPRTVYKVRLDLFNSTCDCPDFAKRGLKCKHIFSVEIHVQKIINKDGSTTITQTKRISYPQNWKAYDTASINQKEMFLKLLNDLCQNIAEPAYTFGRPNMPLKDMVFSSALKVFTTFSLRRFSTDMRDAQSKGYIAKSPYYSTVARYMEDAELTPILKELITLSALPLKSVESHFSIDSTGFSTSRFARWYDHKYGKDVSKRVWLKAHLVCGTGTHIIPAVEITNAYETDTENLEDLIKETSENFDVKELSADMGYLSRHNFDVIAEVGAVPYIPFKSSSIGKPQGHNHIWRKMYDYFVFNRGEFLAKYHNRSNIETSIYMIKSKFGNNIRSKNETAQINELLLKVLCHNICVVIQESFELGIASNFAQ